MVFSSITFLYYYLPLVVILYLITPGILKNYLLLAASLVFYGWGEPKYLILISASILVNYLLGLSIEKDQGTWKAKLWLALSVLYSIGTLGYYKYADFFIHSFNQVLGLQLSLLRVVLPIGISFYTFQILSYVIDVYRKDTEAQKNIFYLAVYVTLFPQLIAGPIVRYKDINKSLHQRSHTVEQIYIGLRRFMIGLMKKVILANTYGELCKNLKYADGKNVLLYWLYGIGFCLQIYFDFSGYSDMAIGLGKFFGFDFLENFNYPYISKSITEFWRRWHISLGSWFRDYLYIPLGGNRVRTARWLFNIFIVWFLTGLWHGADWNFVIWGLFYAILLVIEKLWLKERLEKLPDIISHVYVLFMTLIGFIIFDASSLSAAVESIYGLFAFTKLPLTDLYTRYQFQSYGFILLIGMVAATPIPKRLGDYVQKIKYGIVLKKIFEPVFLILCLMLVTAYLVDASYNPFLYFRF